MGEIRNIAIKSELRESDGMCFSVQKLGNMTQVDKKNSSNISS